MQYLVIANVASGASIELVELLLQPEARRVWEMYVGDLVRSVWYRADKPGAVLLFEAPGEQEVRDAVSSLPMVEAGLLDVEIIPLKPYDGISTLFMT